MVSYRGPARVPIKEACPPCLLEILTLAQMIRVSCALTLDPHQVDSYSNLGWQVVTTYWLAVGFWQCAGTRSGLVKQPDVQQGTDDISRWGIWLSRHKKAVFGDKEQICGNPSRSHTPRHATCT